MIPRWCSNQSVQEKDCLPVRLELISRPTGLQEVVTASCKAPLYKLIRKTRPIRACSDSTLGQVQHTIYPHDPA
jgi:hypothetical protein